MADPDPRVMPMAAPITATVALITFLLNWAQWFPIMVISRSPDTYTLPVALLSMNSELGPTSRESWPWPF